ncbi:MAG: CotH kinase family protein [Bacilli bacterium]|nr:CotH kinase family protein [Bacilli bacterium]
MKKKLIYLIIIVTIVIIFISLIPNKEIKEEEKDTPINIDTSIPRIYIEGDTLEIKEKDDIKNITLKYVSEELEFESYATIKWQGNSSLRFKKKNYNIKLYSDENREEKYKVDTGWGNEYKYCLKANFIDQTHARNIVTASLSADIQKKYNLFENTPNYGVIDGFPVEVYNNNEFLGLYTWNIPKDEWLLGLDKNNINHIAIMPKEPEGENYSAYDSYDVNTDWEFEAGYEQSINKFNRVLKFIIDSNNEEFKTNFEKYFNLDATLNYYVLLEMAMLIDNVDRNIIMVTYDGNIWYPTHYDLDISWGTNWTGLRTHRYTTDIETYFKGNLFFIKFRDNFKKEIANRYFELRKDIFTKDYILNKFEDFSKLIPETSIQKEKERWYELRGYDYNQISSFLDTRIPLIDKKMNTYLEEK